MMVLKIPVVQLENEFVAYHQPLVPRPAAGTLASNVQGR
jgi:hypothetical protein